jgi:hypothetical protein
MHAEGLTQIAWAPWTADAEAYLVKNDNHPNAAVALTSTTTFASTDLVVTTCPGWPVVPVVIVTDAAESSAWTSVNVTITGIDQFGGVLSETKAGTNSSGTWTATFLNAFESFDTVTVVIVLPDGAIDETNDDIQMGFAKTYGLGRRVRATSSSTSTDVLGSFFDEAADAGTLNTIYQTYVFAGTPDSAKMATILMRPSVYTKPG